jgi:regulator of protease activity HflC (stomatin/prohibitin superfamily)
MNELDTTIVLAIAFTIFLIINLFYALVVVKEGSVAIIERFGAKEKILYPGLGLIVPFVDKVAMRPSTKELLIQGTCDNSMTKDGASISIDFGIIWRREYSQEALADYRSENITEQLDLVGRSFLRTALGRMSVEEVNNNRSVIQAEVKQDLQNEFVNLGVVVVGVTLSNPILPPQIKESMELVLTADKMKYAQEQQANADLYTANRKADAIKVTSEADSFKLENYAKIIVQYGHDATNYDLAVNQVKAISEVGSSNSTKSVILPTNVTESLGVIETVMTYLKDHQSTDKKPVEAEIKSNDTDNTSSGQQDETFEAKTSSTPLPDDNPNLANDDGPSQKG